MYVFGRSHLFCDLSFFVGLVNIWYITRVQDHVDILEECFILLSTKKNPTNPLLASTNTQMSTKPCTSFLPSF